MKKQLFVGIGVLCIIGAAVVWKIKSAPAPPAGQQSASMVDASKVPVGAKVVKMGNDAYTPDKITIKKGETVAFVNESKDYRWPASNLHPTHEIYPEFDPREPVPPGKLWSFTFDKVGEWKWHDHLVPYIVGSITVQE